MQWNKRGVELAKETLPRHVTRGTCMQATRAARALVACTASAGAISENIAAQLQSKSRRTLGTLLPTTDEWSFPSTWSQDHLSVYDRDVASQRLTGHWVRPHSHPRLGAQPSTVRHMHYPFLGLVLVRARCSVELLQQEHTLKSTHIHGSSVNSPEVSLRVISCATFAKKG
jgi:hypothetical protein